MHSYPYRLAVLAERVSQEFATSYRARHGLTRAEWRVLAHLSSAAEPVSVRDPRDRRLVALSLTGKGRAVMAEMIPLARGFEAELRVRLGSDAKAFLRGVGRLMGDGHGHPV